METYCWGLDNIPFHSKGEYGKSEIRPTAEENMGNESIIPTFPFYNIVSDNSCLLIEKCLPYAANATKQTRPTVNGATTCTSFQGYTPPAQSRARSIKVALTMNRKEPIGSHIQATCFHDSLGKSDCRFGW